MFCCKVLCVFSGFGNHLCVSSWCLVAIIVLWLFAAVPLVGLHCVIMVFLDHMLTYSFGSMLYRQIVGMFCFVMKEASCCF